MYTYCRDDDLFKARTRNCANCSVGNSQPKCSIDSAYNYVDRCYSPCGLGPTGVKFSNRKPFPSPTPNDHPSPVHETVSNGLWIGLATGGVVAALTVVLMTVYFHWKKTGPIVIVHANDDFRSATASAPAHVLERKQTSNPVPVPGVHELEITHTFETIQQKSAQFCGESTTVSSS